MRDNRGETTESQVFHGLVFDIYQSDASLGPEQHRFEYARCADAVRVYPINLLTASITLIYERRFGIPGGEVLRTVSGSIEAAENPLAAARREMREEIGMDSPLFVLFHTSTPMLKVRHTVFHVAAINPTSESRMHTKSDPFEKIRPLNILIEQAIEAAWNGEFAEDIVAFGLLALDRQVRMTPSRFTTSR